MRLKGKVAIITGGGRGIGRAIALAFAREGAFLVLAARTSSEVEEVASEINKSGRAIACSVDVKDAAAVKRLVNKALEVYGTIDILVACHGVYGPIGPLHENDLDDWENSVNVNLFGTMRCVREVIPHMISRNKGKIILMSGAGAPNALPNFSSYAASKTAIVNFTETVSKEVESHNIDINAISPGLVFTKLQERVFEAGEKAGPMFRKMQEGKGGVPPEKAAELAVFLASSDSDGITGRSISAVHDDYPSWSSEDFKKSDYGKIRRIDDFFFTKVAR